MIRSIAMAGIISIVFLKANAQTRTLTGVLADRNENIPVSGATVLLQLASDTTIKFNTVTSAPGRFTFNNVGAGNYILRFTSVGYQQTDTAIYISDTSTMLGRFYLAKEATLLGEVIVQATPPPVRQRADTLEYSASAFKVNPDANVEDIVKKMPGVTIEGGTVKAGGEDVRRVTIDGREFFGDDATAALRNLPAEVVDKIQVFDRLSDQAQLTGFEDANTVKAINIVTRANMRNGQFGRLYAGYGTDERYSAGGNVSFFNGNRRISLVGLANNVNQQNFATEDLLGVTSSGNRGGGPRGGGGGPRGGGGPGGFRGGGGQGNFLVGQQGGISRTNSIGINYSDLWGKNFQVTGSYFFNNTNNVSDRLTNRQLFLPGDSSQFYRESDYSSSRNYNHRVNMRIEYKIDSSNTLIISPSASFQQNNSYSNVTGINSYAPIVAGSPSIGDLISQSLNENDRRNVGYNFNNNILYRHAFAKRGRTISINLGTSLNNRDGESYLDAINQYYKAGAVVFDSLLQFSDNETRGRNISTNISYTEPIGKRSQLQVNYNPSWNFSKANQMTFQYDDADGKYSRFDSSLSNRFDNLYSRQNGGLTYRFGDRDRMLSVGVEYQHAELESDQEVPYVTTVNRSFQNLLPNAMLRTKIGQRSNIRLFYRTSTSPPSINQLQDVINNNNPLFLSTGNPELDQNYTHTLATRYQFTNTTKGLSVFANLFLQKIDNYVANATYIASADSVLSPTVTLFRGSQLSKPVNLDGFQSLRSFITVGMPLKFIKSNLNWNFGYTQSRNPGLINNVDNISRTQNYNAGLVVSSNVSEFVDFNLSYSANFNVVKNSIQPQLNNNFFNQVASFQLNLLSKNGWVFQNDLNNQTYRGLTDGFNLNFWLWNMSAGKKFLKDQKGELRLSVFDLLKQNQSISRVATETYVEDVQTQVLQQYFMLTFSYRLRNFGSSRR